MNEGGNEDGLWCPRKGSPVNRTYATRSLRRPAPPFTKALCWRPRKAGLRPTLRVAHLVPSAGFASHDVRPIFATLRFGVRLDSIQGTPRRSAREAWRKAGRKEGGNGLGVEVESNEAEDTTQGARTESVIGAQERAVQQRLNLRYAQPRLAGASIPPTGGRQQSVASA